MMTMIEELVRHKWWANSNLLHAIEQHAPAAEDDELRKLLHHTLIANRYWLLLILGQPFVDEEERRMLESHSAVIARFAETEQLERNWISSVTTSDLERAVQPRALPDITITVAQAVIPSSLHSHGHTPSVLRAFAPSAEHLRPWTLCCGSATGLPSLKAL